MPKPTIECGTPGGYNKHRRNGQEPCRPCLDAINDSVRANRITQGKTHQIRVHIDVLRELATHPHAHTILTKTIGTATLNAIQEHTND